MTEKPKLVPKVLRFEPEFLEEIQNYQKKNHIPHFTTTVMTLIELGLKNESTAEQIVNKDFLKYLDRVYTRFEDQIKEVKKEEE